jgi:uncharacterized membrane protein YccC
MRRAAAELLAALGAELADLTLSGLRARLASTAALAVGLATLLALMLRLNDPWWAGISAFVCTQASGPQSFAKGLLRVTGTAAGAGIGFLLAPWVVYDPVATLLFLFVAGALAILGSLFSPHGYAWLLGGLTAVMVMLGSLDDPAAALTIAVYRTAEISIGVVAAMLAAFALAPPGTTDDAPPPGWSSLFGRNWHALHHAVRTGLVIASVPVVWRVLELPNLSQMAISVGAVMAVPVLTGVAERDQAAVVRRAVHRLTGCTLGGGTGLLLLALPLTNEFLPWLLLLIAGAAVGIQIQCGRHGIGLVGTQATVALILTLEQGFGPPTSLVPAANRLAGILGALGLMVIASLLFGLTRAARPRHTGATLGDHVL